MATAAKIHEQARYIVLRDMAVAEMRRQKPGPGRGHKGKNNMSSVTVCFPKGDPGKHVADRWHKAFCNGKRIWEAMRELLPSSVGPKTPDRDQTSVQTPGESEKSQASPEQESVLSGKPETAPELTARAALSRVIGFFARPNSVRVI